MIINRIHYAAFSILLLHVSIGLSMNAGDGEEAQQNAAVPALTLQQIQAQLTSYQNAIDALEGRLAQAAIQKPDEQLIVLKNLVEQEKKTADKLVGYKAQLEEE